MTAPNISAQPKSSLAVSGSSRKMTANTSPNTDSKESRMEEVFALKYFCPTVWRRNPSMELKKAR